MTKKSKRMMPEDRKAEILAHAVSVAAKSNYRQLTRRQVAEAADCSPALISSYFGTMAKFERIILRAAIRMENLSIIAQMLVSKDSRIPLIPEELKNRALQSLVTE